MAIYHFSLPGIKCINCVGTVKRVLNEAQHIPISSIEVDVITKILTVTVTAEDHNPLAVQKSIIETLDGVGEKCVFIQEPMHHADEDKNTPEEQSSQEKLPFWRKLLKSHIFLGVVGTGSGLALLILSFVGLTLPLTVMIALSAASTALTIALGAESYREAFVKLKNRTLTMDTLFTISTLTILVVSIAALFVPWLPMMFDTALLIYGFRHIGIAIEESIKQTIGFRVQFKDRLPDVVTVLENESAKEKPLSELKPGELIIVNPGDLIPIDGICESEKSLIFDTILTGSSLPRKLERNEYVSAGMHTAEDADPLYIRATKSSSESYLAKLDQHIAQSNFEKAPIETVTDKVLQYFIPSVLMISVLTIVGVGSFFPLALAIQCGVAVLVSACPCTLGFIIPLAVRIGMNKAAEHGVQFKSGKSLQDAAHVSRVVFDLHGTLTKGVFTVGRCGVLPEAGITTRELLALLSSLEKESSHPIAKSICEYVKKQNISSELSMQVTELDKSNHSGLKAKIDGVTYTVGNLAMMKAQGFETKLIQDSIHLEEGDPVVYLARENNMIGYVLLTDPLRDDARNAVHSLKELGMDVYIFTGADEATAHRFGAMVGIDPSYIRAGCEPASKSEAIKELREGGKLVSMIGDASNDAFAITESNFGIAIESHGGDQVAQDQAGALIQSGSLLPVISAFAVARQTVANIKQNLLLSLGYNLAAVGVASGLLLSVGVVLNPAAGVGLMFLQSMLVLLNAYRFKSESLNHIQQPSDNNVHFSGGSYQLLKANMPRKGRTFDLDESLEDATVHHDLYNQESKPVISTLDSELVYSM